MEPGLNHIALIDPVGKKAGMDQYDLLLLEGISKTGLQVQLYSNFSEKTAAIRIFQTFHNLNTTKIQSVAGTFTGFIRSLFLCKKQKAEWLILHVFRAGIFDLFTFSLAKFLGFKICAIVHDIESLDTFTLPIVRKMVIDSLPDIRVVHNEFSLEQLAKSFQRTSGIKTVVIPHVNFIHLFRHYHENPDLLTALKKEADCADAIYEKLRDDLRRGVKIVLFFGQIKNAKGLDTLLRAIAITGGNFKLIVAGRVREGSWSQYEKTIHELNISHKVIPVIRFITDKERDFLFSICTVIVLPYTRIYQSGVLLMAMSFPKPVIASDLSPNSEVVINNENGLLFQSGNIHQLSEKINILLNDPSLCHSLSKAALKSVENRFNPDLIGKRFSEILK